MSLPRFICQCCGQPITAFAMPFCTSCATVVSQSFDYYESLREMAAEQETADEAQPQELAPCA